MGTQYISVNSIDPDPEQPRKNKPEAYLRNELAMSIANEGMNNPIHVRENSEIPGRFWIINGECRWTAVSMFVKDYWDGVEKDGFKIEDGIMIECKIKNLASSGDVLKNQIMDNMVRLNMRPLETLEAIDRAINEVSIEDCSKAFGISVAVIEADLPILTLPVKMKAQWDAGKLPKPVARKIADLPSKQHEKAYEWAIKGQNVESMLKKIEAYVNKMNQLDLFDKAKNAATSDEKKDARVVFSRIFKVMKKVSGSPYLTDNAKLLITVNSQKTAEIERTAKEMRKISDTLIDELQQYRVRTKAAVV